MYNDSQALALIIPIIILAVYNNNNINIRNKVWTDLIFILFDEIFLVTQRKTLHDTWVEYINCSLFLQCRYIHIKWYCLRRRTYYYYYHIDSILKCPLIIIQAYIIIIIKFNIVVMTIVGRFQRTWVKPFMQRLARGLRGIKQQHERI